MRDRWKAPCVYILASKPYGTLYTGVTSDLPGRTGTHKQGLIGGFSKTHGIHRLVYYEHHETMQEAIIREKRIKRWNRAWKFRIIHLMNPPWGDLFDEQTGEVREGPGDLELRGIGCPREFPQ